MFPCWCRPLIYDFYHIYGGGTSFGLSVALFLLQNDLPLSPRPELDGSSFTRADAATPKNITQQSSINKERFRMGGEDMGSDFWLIISSFTAVVMDHRDKN